MVRHFQLAQVLRAEARLVFVADQVLQEGRLAAHRHRVELELRLAACLLRGDVLEQRRVLEQLGQTVRRRLPLLVDPVDGAKEAANLLKAAQAALAQIDLRPAKAMQVTRIGSSANVVSW